MRLLGWDDLKSKGIPWTKQHIYRLIRKGDFPAPVKLSAQTNVWPESVIDEFIKTRIAAHDTAA